MIKSDLLEQIYKLNKRIAELEIENQRLSERSEKLSRISIKADANSRPNILMRDG